jgi:isocitrate lyase
MATREQQIAALQKDWDTNPRWKGVTRNYTAEDVVRLRGSVQIEHTLARAAPKSCGTWSTTSPSSTRWAR